MASSSDSGSRTQKASDRILEAAARRIVAAGVASLAMNDVAAEAEVSKALIHYHFRDKDTLLARLVERLVRSLVERERAALATYADQHSPLAVDALWDWLDGELRSGTIRVLLELGGHEGEAVRAASARARTLRREVAGETIGRLFDILDLRPRVPFPLLAQVVVAFIDGLALEVSSGEHDAESDVTRSPRVAFDVFWLAMLNLAE
jgi:AcrR family transcriptional regulator